MSRQKLYKKKDDPPLDIPCKQNLKKLPNEVNISFPFKIKILTLCYSCPGCSAVVNIEYSFIKKINHPEKP